MAEQLIDDYEIPGSSLGALRTFLLMHKPIVDMVGIKVFLDGIPKDYISVKRINCINLVSSGGPEDGSEAPRDNVRVNICCYGGNSIMVGRLDGAVLIPLKRLRGAVFQDDPDDEDSPKVYIKYAKPGGPMPGFDPDTDWPYIRRSYMIQFGYVVG